MHSTRALRSAISLVAVLVLAGLCSPVTASDRGHTAADQVSEASYQDFLENWLFTHAGDNRGYGPEHDLARDNIRDLFTAMGLDVTLEPFVYNSVTYYNVVGTKVGTVYPDREYIVGGHYDSVDNPGADDNGSGVALILEAARILSQYDSDYTIRFIAFDREEQGLIGSQAYVSDHWADDIRGMISTDMVAYNTGANSADVYGRSASNGIKTALSQAITEYGEGLQFQIGGRLDASDHAPFEWAGIPACLLIEDWGNPFYHTQNDNCDMPNYLDYPYAVRMTRSIVGYLVDTAGVQVTSEQTVEPSAYNVGFGAYRSGSLNDLFDSDDAYLVIEQRPAFTPLLPLIRLDVMGTAGADVASVLAVTIETSVSSIPTQSPQELLLYNYDAVSWELVDARTATTTDTTVTVIVDTDPERFLENGTGDVAMRIDWYDPGNVFFPAWVARIDQAIWTITP